MRCWPTRTSLLKLQTWVRVPIERPVATNFGLRGDPRRCTNKLVITTVGRIILNNKIFELCNEIIEEEERYLPFFNFTFDKGALSAIIAEAFQRCGQYFTVRLADTMKDLGFEMATVSGVTISASDIVVPKAKAVILEKAEKEAAEVWGKRKKGIITEVEKDMEVTRIWDQATKDLTKAMRDNFSKLNSVYMMATSGARGKMDQVRQLAAMRGLLVGPSGRVLDFPIKSNFREGLSVFEYFISTHGGRKGLVDTALKTADSGYLTRRLIDVALDVSVTEHDCGTEDSIVIPILGGETLNMVSKKFLGRVLAEDIIDSETGETVLRHGEEMDRRSVERVMGLGLRKVRVRSVLTCKIIGGVCARCYGWDLAAGQLAQIGDPIGVVAAQSIGEPGTQLTMRTFHTGGIKGRDITQGLPYVETLFEVRGVKSPTVLAEEDGEVIEINEMVYDRVTIQSLDGEKEKTLEVVHPHHQRLKIHFRSRVDAGDVLDDVGQVRVDFSGVVTSLFTDTHKTYWIIKIKNSDNEIREYETPHENRKPMVAVGQRIARGDQLCEGSIDLRKYHLLMGDLPTQLYITSKIQEIYESQNVNTNSKHIEIVTKQMIRFVEITDMGDDSDFYEGDLVDRNFFNHMVDECERLKKKPPKGRSLLQGISKSSLSTESFLAAASFQETTRVLTEAAIEGKIDRLKGLKENVIIGGLIPVGTGRLAKMIEDKAEEELFPVTAGPDTGEPPKAESIF